MNNLWDFNSNADEDNPLVFEQVKKYSKFVNNMALLSFANDLVRVSSGRSILDYVDDVLDEYGG
jgi:hypothetical protein